jgi:hypothetical protein
LRTVSRTRRKLLRLIVAAREEKDERVRAGTGTSGRFSWLATTFTALLHARRLTRVLTLEVLAVSLETWARRFPTLR